MSSTLSVNRMGQTVRRVSHPSDYRPRLTVDQALGLEWQMKAESAHQQLFGERGIRARLIDVIRLARLHGHSAWLAAWLRPVFRELRVGPRSPFNPELVAAKIGADSRENCSLAAFLLNDTPTTRRAAVRDLRAEAAEALALADALEAGLPRVLA